MEDIDIMAEQKIVNTLVGVFVGAILAAAMIPVALQQLAAASFTNISGTGTDVPLAQVALYGVIAIAVIVVVVVLFFKLI